MKRGTRKVITMNGALHPRANFSSLYVSGKDESQGLISVEEAVDQSILGLESCVYKTTETLLSAVKVIGEFGLESTDHFKKKGKMSGLKR